jgi:hypothetical protein
MADRDQPTLARRIQQLAESGDYEGFNAIVGSLNGEPDAVGMDIIKRDPEFKHRITEMCHNAWERKHARRH